MGLFGADIDALYDQANRLQRVAAELRQAQAALGAAAATLVTVWTGPDATKHRSELIEETTRLGEVADTIDSAVRSLMQNADAQRMISSW